MCGRRARLPALRGSPDPGRRSATAPTRSPFAPSMESATSIPRLRHRSSSSTRASAARKRDCSRRRIVRRNSSLGKISLAHGRARPGAITGKATIGRRSVLLQSAERELGGEPIGLSVRASKRQFRRVRRAERQSRRVDVHLDADSPMSSATANGARSNTRPTADSLRPHCHDRGVRSTGRARLNDEGGFISARAAIGIALIALVIYIVAAGLQRGHGSVRVGSGAREVDGRAAEGRLSTSTTPRGPIPNSGIALGRPGRPQVHGHRSVGQLRPGRHPRAARTRRRPTAGWRC